MRLGSRKLSISMLAVLFGSLALLLSACGTTTSTGPQDKAKDQILKMTWSGAGATDVPTLDPGLSSDAQSIPLIDLMFDGLVVLDQNLKVQLWGADKVDVSGDGLTYTFHVRANQKFSDGKAVKASDYAYGMNRTLNPCFASSVNYYLFDLKDASTFANEKCTNGTISAADGQTTPVINTLIGSSIVADDTASTIKLTIGHAAGYFLSALTYPCSYLIEQSVVSGDNLGKDGKWLDSMVANSTNKTGQGGSGMFYLAKQDHAGSIVLKKNPNWWGIAAGKAPQLDEINYTIFAKSETLYATYKSDDSFAYDDGIPAAEVAAAKSEADYKEHGVLSFNAIHFNYTQAPFDSKDARLAWCESVNRDLLNAPTGPLKGLVNPSWTIVPPGMPGYQATFTGPDGVGTTGDPTKAKAHWQAYLAAHGGKAPAKMQLMYNTGSATADNTWQAIQGQIQDSLGIKIELVALDFPSYLDANDHGKYMAHRFGWLADYPDPQDFLTLLYESHSSYDTDHIAVPAADDLMNAADRIDKQDAASVADRISKYNQAERALVDDGGVCPLYHSLGRYRVRTWAKNFELNSQSLVSDEQWTKVYIAKH